MKNTKSPTGKKPGPRRRGKARYIMIGGFLGAGKTTAVGRLARRLSGQGLRVGLITNDQGRNLVDTAMLRSQGFATEEIPGGCFCCRFNSLVEAAQRLTASARPDVFIAEPVGSCTDLAATVTYPLRRLYGDSFTVAPVSVLVDPVRARRVFGLETGGNFSEKVLYIYLKQIEEAEYELTGLMRRFRKLTPGKESNFSINKQSMLLDVYNSITGTLWAVASVSGRSRCSSAASAS